jgi:hypothetical protein
VNAKINRRNADPNSFESALLEKVCNGEEPSDDTAMVSAKQAEQTVRDGNALMGLFGLDGGDDGSD